MNHTNGKGLKPFLRWAGGKQGLVKYLVEHLPSDFNANGNKYFEPFLGAGSLFLATAPHKAVLSDLNEHLIHCFRTIRDDPANFHRMCMIHVNKSSEEYYYKVRETYNENINKFDTAQAARFLYLNRTCFNGIFRVNQQGIFNVPYGHKKNILVPSIRELKNLSIKLGECEFMTGSYEKILEKAKSGDFVYLDPPYPPINGTAYFTHYTKERFNDDDQKKVANVANKLDKIGCKVMISNADLDGIRELYNGWKINKLEVTRFVSCKSKRHKVDELIIINY